MEIPWIVLWSKITTRHNIIKQLKIPKKGKPIAEESEAQYQFQGKSARSQYLFDTDPDWIEDNFMTRDPDFSKEYTVNIFEVKQINIG